MFCSRTSWLGQASTLRSWVWRQRYGTVPWCWLATWWRSPVIDTLVRVACFCGAQQLVLLLARCWEGWRSHCHHPCTNILFFEKQLARPPSLPAGMRCVELGAGVGLVGLALAAMGAQVAITDVEKVLPLMRENLGANGFDPAVG